MSQQNISQIKEQIKKLVSPQLADKYLSVFGDDYLLEYNAEEIATDIKHMERLSTEQQYHISMSKSRKNEQANFWQIKLYKLNDPVSLSRGLPIIENFGFKLLDEIPFKVKLSATETLHICDFGVEVNEKYADKINDGELADKVCDAIVRAFNREIENDTINKLVLFAGLSAREAALMRAISHYIVQTALPFSRAYLASTLCTYPEIARLIFDLFVAKFNITNPSATEADNIRVKIQEALEKVVSLDDDRILKAFLSVVEAFIRTNYYQTTDDGAFKDYMSFKIESAKVPFLPKPLPLYEIYVYSYRFEGIHLRAGKVARGGFRWSDRREDFRTEVLGLVKAQKVKNSVIVPTGSKGGFVCKRLPDPSDRQAYQAEGIRCYKTFISGLLDITDNLVSGSVVPPRDVVRHDGDDPYLVVAADKGTATFSDYANAMSLKYGFWLGDAFASGGSAGYDHKKMGITARGAWEACKRHFRHLGINTQEQAFTVVGLGDMAGDVFGNGMLLSNHIKLIAAFNHMHIFLDPNPNVEESFKERERMFNLPTSSWKDYDVSKISQGGGIFERSAKSIPLSDEVRAWLGTSAKEMSPNELINTILKAKADLFYNGGIGTYIKAESESHEMVKDKANDTIRVNGNELNVRVVVEGGNLGATQLGRIEFAKKGGLICTDAIDNSAGVDCSDHEVNIKILFSDVMQRTGMTIEERNKILEEMTDNVAQLVLRDNYLQTQVLSYADARSHELFKLTVNFINKLEKRGELDRKVEFLPGIEEIKERQRLGIGLTSPELAVLLAYAKMTLDHEILGSDLVKGNDFDELLINYFPEHIKANFKDAILSHYLRKEIISNQVANLLINRMGITFASRFEDEFRVSAPKIVEAFWAVYKMFDLDRFYTYIESLDNKVHATVQVEMLIRLKKAVERTARWILRRYKDTNDILPLIDRYKTEVTQIVTELPNLLANADYPKIAALEEHFVEAGVDRDFAALMARTGAIPQVLDLISIAHTAKSATGAEHGLINVARNYFYIGRVLRMDWLRKNLIALPEGNKWQAIARSALIADGYVLYSKIISLAIADTDANDPNFTDTWMLKETDKISKFSELIDELQSFGELEPVMLSAVVRELDSIVS